MTTETDRQVRQMADRIKDIQQTTPEGVTDTQLRAATTWVRDVHDNLERLWTHAGFSGSPHLRGYAVKWPLPSNGWGYCFDGEEDVSIEQHTSMLAAIGVQVPEGMSVTSTPTGAGYYVEMAEPDPHHGDFYFEIRTVPLKEFMNGTVFFVNDLHATRFDVVEFCAYGLGYIHTNADRYLRKSKDKAAKLHAFQEMEPTHVRPNADFMLLGIARAIAQSDDVKAFLDRV